MRAAPARREIDGDVGSKRVLVIEDNHDVADMLGKYLELVGHEVIVAHDGHAGLEAARRHKPHVLICDIGLPGVDGYEVLRRLKQHPAYQHIPVVVLTASDLGDAARKHVLDMGAALFLEKPIGSEELLVEIKRILSK